MSGVRTALSVIMSHGLPQQCSKRSRKDTCSYPPAKRGRMSVRSTSPGSATPRRLLPISTATSSSTLPTHIPSLLSSFSSTIPQSGPLTTPPSISTPFPPVSSSTGSAMVLATSSPATVLAPSTSNSPKVSVSYYV